LSIEPGDQPRRFTNRGCPDGVNVSRFVALVLVLILLLGGILVLGNGAAFAAGNGNASASNLYFVEAPDARGLEKQKIASCENLLVREMNLAGRELPRVLVLHVSESTGKALKVRTSIRRNLSKDHGDLYYEFWIVGQAKAPDYAVSLQTLLQEHFQVQMTDAERKEVLTRVVRILNATVSAYGQ
jgi:hypothetical protein